MKSSAREFVIIALNASYAAPNTLETYYKMGSFLTMNLSAVGFVIS